MRRTGDSASLASTGHRSTGSRVLSVEDKIEINELIARYNVAIDTGDAEGWAATFAPDGVFDGIVGRFEGREQIEAFARRYWEDPQYEDFRACQHWVNNVLIDGEGDEATLRADHQMVRPTPTGGEILLVAFYDDRLRRIDGHWLFSRRCVRAHDDPEARR